MLYWDRPIILASASPRRKEMLAQLLDEYIVSPPTCDDGTFDCGTMTPKRWVHALAIMKAQNVQQQCTLNEGTILSADTICVLDGAIYGQPKDASEARKMITSMIGRSHEVMTSWCLVSSDGSHLESGVEKTVVRLGELCGSILENHLHANEWVGKAGGYNYSDCLHRGWQLDCDGECDTITGLPTKKLKNLLLNTYRPT